MAEMKRMIDTVIKDLKEKKGSYTNPKPSAVSANR